MTIDPVKAMALVALLAASGCVAGGLYRTDAGAIEGTPAVDDDPAVDDPGVDDRAIADG